MYLNCMKTYEYGEAFSFVYVANNNKIDRIILKISKNVYLIIIWENRLLLTYKQNCWKENQLYIKENIARYWYYF